MIPSDLPGKIRESDQSSFPGKDERSFGRGGSSDDHRWGTRTGVGKVRFPRHYTGVALVAELIECSVC